MKYSAANEKIISRAHDLVDYSDRVYRAIDQRAAGEVRSRRILRLSTHLIAQSLQTYSLDSTGTYLHSVLHSELAAGGIGDHHLGAWPAYQTMVHNLPSPRYPQIHDHQLDQFASLYADVERRTVARDGSFETDASHAVHLTALSLPYAVQFYPDLNPRKLALFAMMHDALEAYAGDTPTLNASEEVLAKKREDEYRALLKIIELFGKRYPALVSLIEAYEEMSCDESRFIKTFDKLDTEFTIGYSRGIALTRDYKLDEAAFLALAQTNREKLINGFGGSYPDLIDIKAQLSTYYHDFIDW